MLSRRGLLFHNATVTAGEGFIGLFVGAGAGILLGVAFVRFPLMERAVYPLAIIVKSVPVIVIAPLLVVWLGYGLRPKITMAALLVFFPTLVNIVGGLRSVDREAEEYFYSMSASRSQYLSKLGLPSALPYIFSALRIGAASAFMAALVAEWTGANAGLGYLIQVSAYQFDLPLLWASVMTSAALATLAFGVVVAVERMVMPWTFATAT
jgi:NitT/TauT family transport system permease protein